MRAVEAVWEHQWTRAVATTVSVYEYRVSDLIDLVFDPERAIFQNQNGGKIRTRGVELGLRGRTRSGLTGHASYAYKHALDVGDGGELVNAPRHVAKATLGVSAWDLFTTATQVSFETGRLTVYGTRTEAFVVANVTVRTRPLLGGLRARLQVRNVFDTPYALPGTFHHRQHALNQDGRTWMLGIEYGF